MRSLAFALSDRRPTEGAGQQEHSFTHVLSSPADGCVKNRPLK